MRLSKLAMLFLAVVATVSLTAATADKETGETLVSASGASVAVTQDQSAVHLLVTGNNTDKKRCDLVGTAQGKKACIINKKLSGNDVVIEASSSGTKVRIGSLERIVSLKKQEHLRPARVTVRSHGKSLIFTSTVAPRKVRYFSLSTPDRIVVDFVGIKGHINRFPGLRSANHPAGFRVVIERKPARTVSLHMHGKTVELRNAHKLVASFKKTEKKQSATTVASTQTPRKVAAETVPSVTLATLTGIAFIGEDPEILKIKANKPFTVRKEVKGKSVEFIIPNAKLPKDKEQIFDAASLNGPVRELAIYNKGSSVHILAKMATKHFNLSLEGEQNGKDFIFASVKKPMPTSAVAGYSETVSTVNKAAVAQADMTVDNGVNNNAVEMGDTQKKYSGKKINLDFKNVDILDILRLMSDISKLNIIAGDDVKGTITVRLFNIAWDEALDVILRSKSLGKERYGNIIRVATLKTLQREKEAELAKKKAQKKLEPIKVRLIAVNYAMAGDLVPQVKELLTDRGTVSVDKRTNVLIVKDVAETLDKAEQLVEYLDTQTPQVLIEARIVEATSQAAQGFGVEWNSTSTMSDGNGHPINATFPHNAAFGGAVNVPGPADRSGHLGFSFGSIGAVSDLNLTLNVMEAEGKIKIVSSPKVATLDNKEATIQQGVSIPITTRSQGGEITTKYIDATLELKATPHITAEGAILMQLHINKSEPDWSNANYLGEPSIIKKEAKTDVLINSGDTVVIGGVYTNKTAKVERGIPFLKDIPVLGWLFKSTETKVERSELLIFLTPKIMNKLKSKIATTDEEVE